MSFSLTNSIAILERTPATLRALLSGLGPQWTDRNEGGETWTPFNVVGHLLDGEEFDWIPRTRMMLLPNEADRRFAPIDRFRHLTATKGKTLASLLDEFAMRRAASVAELHTLVIGAKELAHTAQHPAFGTVTLQQLIATWTVHDLNHIAQIVRVMAKQYKGEIGPWEAFLPIVRISSGGSG